MNKFKNIIYLFGLSIVMILAGCSDPDDEITSIDYDRLFSPTEVKANTVNRINVRLTWKAVKHAESYTIEVFDNGDLLFDGTPVKTLTDITGIAYTIDGLEGETAYSIRIQAVSPSKPSSKWVGVTATTDTEQIFYAIAEEDLKATSVTLRWPEGEAVTEIILTPGDIKHVITSEEIAAGEATITGLTSETEYTAKLMNGSKTRGSRTFTTLIDLAGAIAVNPDDDFATMLAEAKSGDAFALYPGTYGTSTKFVVKENVEIKAVRPKDKPVLSGFISIENGASLLLKEIVIDGTDNESNQAIVFSTADTNYGALIVDGCEIKNHDKGLYYLNVASLVESITINNCIIFNIVCNGGDFMDSRTGAVKSITLSNSTVYNSCAARDLIRYDNSSANFPGISPVISVTNCTLVGVSNVVNKRLLYVRFAGNSIIFKNNIVTDTEAIFSNQSATAVPEFGRNNYFNAPNLLPGGVMANFYDDGATKLDPQFKNASEGDFTVGNIDVTAGDPRWLP